MIWTVTWFDYIYRYNDLMFNASSFNINTDIDCRNELCHQNKMVIGTESILADLKIEFDISNEVFFYISDVAECCCHCHATRAYIYTVDIHIQSISSWLWLCLYVCVYECIFPGGAIICFLFCIFFSAKYILYENHHQPTRLRLP